jgi:hypothetical protein
MRLARFRDSSPAQASSASRRWLQWWIRPRRWRPLGERRGHIAVVPSNQHQHIVDTGVFRCQAADLDRFPLAERRDYFGGHAPSRERKPDLALQVVVPAESLFFWPIRVDDDFIVDSFFAEAALAQLGHVVLNSRACKTVDPMSWVGFQHLFSSRHDQGLRHPRRCTCSGQPQCARKVGKVVLAGLCSWRGWLRQPHPL